MRRRCRISPSLGYTRERPAALRAVGKGIDAEREEEELSRWRREIAAFLRERLALELRADRAELSPAGRGVDFGSFARGDARDDSDIDVFIEFEDDKRTYENFFALHELLESLLGRSVDLVTDKA